MAMEIFTVHINLNRHMIYIPTDTKSSNLNFSIPISISIAPSKMSWSRFKLSPISIHAPRKNELITNFSYSAITNKIFFIHNIIPSISDHCTVLGRPRESLYQISNGFFPLRNFIYLSLVRVAP